MIDIAIGIIIASFIAWLISYNKKQEQRFNALQWIIIGAISAYTVFVLELIASFFREGAPQAALVMGGIFGFIAIVAWVIVTRFIIIPKNRRQNEEA